MDNYRRPTQICLTVCTVLLGLSLAGRLAPATAASVTDAFRKTAVAVVVDVTTITDNSDDEFRESERYIKSYVQRGWDVSIVVVGPNSHELIRATGRLKEPLLSKLHVALRQRADQKALAKKGKKRPQGSFIIEGIKSAQGYLNEYGDHKRKLIVLSDLVLQRPAVHEKKWYLSYCPRFSGTGPVSVKLFAVRPDVCPGIRASWRDKLNSERDTLVVEPDTRLLSARDM